MPKKFTDPDDIPRISSVMSVPSGGRVAAGARKANHIINALTPALPPTARSP